MINDPMFALIDQHVQIYTNTSQKDLDTLHALVEHKEFAKKTLLLSEGEICKFELFINKGCIRNYYLDDKGEEVTLQFATEGWWVSDIASFSEAIHSRMFIETLEDCDVLWFTPDAKEKLLHQAPCFERMFRILVQRNLASIQERLFRTIATTATEKYLDFIERYPAIPQRVAQHYIASYLGFSPEFLSKVRTRLSKK
jgi:CRP-like cAMP-binding protein